MTARSFIVYVLVFAAGFAAATVGNLSRPSKPRTSQRFPDRIHIDQPNPSAVFPARVRTDLRVDQVTDADGTVLHEQKVLHENAKPAWVIKINGQTFMAVPE